MTLKEFLELNNINSTSPQRSKIGRLINTTNENPRVTEDGYFVVNYCNIELETPENIGIIINFLNTQS